ncbi:hypothetical protein Egran_00805 [Elaphomyces granulatus]|uniref:INO80 complex subunit B-like conserved region domain-containing protein n=1 Tax=Elaphomyces granulatus TaxID=519963 RepID=A0A232M4T7_9EURO|nr:hypothetical protein Egran_00805 [Elaphomyces granulatus]
MSTGRSLRSRTATANTPSQPASNTVLRSSRVTRGLVSSPAITVSRTPSNLPEESRKSIRLTVKMPSSKLREVTSSSSGKIAGSSRRSVNIFAENPILTGPRNSRSKKKLVEVNTSDDEDLEEEDEEEEGEEEEEADSSEDAPGEEDDLDADGDMDMDDAPPQPPPRRHVKPALMVTPAAKSGPIKGMEKKEIELDDDDNDDEEEEEEEDDEELSELESDAEGEPDESGAQDDELGEGGPEDEELDEEDGEEDEDEEGEGQRDSDEPTPATGSRASTPDLSKLTKRQRGSLGGDFLQLPMEPQVKKHLTAEEHAMRRAEMARRRKNLSEKRNEEEKMDTINRLLKKQTPKRRGRIPVSETAAEASPDVHQEAHKPDPTMIRWVSNHNVSRVGVPGDLLGTPASRVFGHAPIVVRRGRRLVEEI